MVYFICFSGLNEFVPENLLSVFDEYELEVTKFPGVLISYHTFSLKSPRTLGQNKNLVLSNELIKVKLPP